VIDAVVFDFDGLIVDTESSSFRAWVETFEEVRLPVAIASSSPVEDSAHGVAAAKAAGLWCVAVPGPLTRTLDFSAAHVTLESLADATVADVLGRLGPIAR
jgi:beta-phosphoglucomutase-like phosphatase (HAD superfamily)